MSNKAALIRRQYYDKFNSCGLDTMQKWQIEEEITDTLYEKGYDLVNVCTAPCEYGIFNALDCYTTVAEKLAGQIAANGFEIILRKNPQKKSISWIIFPYNLIIELVNVVNDFEEVES